MEKISIDHIQNKPKTDKENIEEGWICTKNRISDLNQSVMRRTPLSAIPSEKEKEELAIA
jgi:hypothetical protein